MQSLLLLIVALSALGVTQARAQTTRQDYDKAIDQILRWEISFPIADAKIGSLRCGDVSTATNLDVRLQHIAILAQVSANGLVGGVKDEQMRMDRVVLLPCDRSDAKTAIEKAYRKFESVEELIRKRDVAP